MEKERQAVIAQYNEQEEKKCQKAKKKKAKQKIITKTYMRNFLKRWSASIYQRIGDATFYDVVVIAVVIVVINFVIESIFGVPAHNWKGEYYANQQLDGYPRIIRDDGGGFINYDWAKNGPSEIVGNDHFSVRWSRTIKVSANTTYLFCVKSDDGVRLFVDGNLLIGDWRNHYNWTTYGAMLQLSEGNHNIIVEYYENRWDANIRVYWKNIEPYIADAKWGMTDDFIEAALLDTFKKFVSKDEGELTSSKSEMFQTTHWDYKMPKLVYSSGNSTIEYLFTPHTKKLYRINVLQRLPAIPANGSETVKSLSGGIIMTATGDGSSVSFYAPYSITRLAENERVDMLPARRYYDELSPRMKEQVRINVLKDFGKHPEKYYVIDGTLYKK